MKNGFTLIELLVAITIISLLVTFGLTAYTKGQQRQLIRGAADSLTNTLERIHQQALVGYRPADCGGAFEGYSVQTYQDTNQLIATSLCLTNDGTPDTYELEHLTFVSDQAFIFLPLTAGIDLGGANTINLDYLDILGNTHRFRLSAGGIIEYLGEL